LWIVSKAMKKKLNLDEPLNRFLTFTGTYLIFVSFIFQTVVDQQAMFHTNTKNADQWLFNHSVLSVFAVAMLWQDFYLLFTLRSKLSFFKFWRVYDIVMHITLTSSLIFRLIKIDSFDPSCVGDILPVDEDRCESTAAKREHYNDLEGKLSNIFLWLNLLLTM
jgi:hypothetical protein